MLGDSRSEFGIEMCHEDPGIDVEHEAHDEVKQLKKDYIGKNSKISYPYSLVNFLFYTYKYQKHLIHIIQEDHHYIIYILSTNKTIERISKGIVVII